jgi:hypothetical protein
LFSFPGLIFPEIALEEKRVDRDGSRCPRRNKLEMTCATISLLRHPEIRNFPAAASRDVWAARTDRQWSVPFVRA